MLWCLGFPNLITLTRRLGVRAKRLSWTMRSLVPEGDPAGVADKSVQAFSTGTVEAAARVIGELYSGSELTPGVNAEGRPDASAGCRRSDRRRANISSR